MIAADDKLFVSTDWGEIQGNTCYRLNAATGETLIRFKTPVTPGSTNRPDWGFLSIHGDVLVAGIQPVEFNTYAFHLREMRRYQNDFFDVIRSWKNFEFIESKERAWRRQRSSRISIG